MSSGIMERNLPVATELGEGDMVRIVTSAGNSKQIDADAFGGGGYFKVVRDAFEGTLDKTYNEITNAFINGTPVVLVVDSNGDMLSDVGIAYLEYYGHITVGTERYVVHFLGSEDNVATVIRFESTSADGVLTYTE